MSVRKAAALYSFKWLKYGACYVYVFYHEFFLNEKKKKGRKEKGGYEETHRKWTRAQDGVSSQRLAGQMGGLASGQTRALLPLLNSCMKTKEFLKKSST